MIIVIAILSASIAQAQLLDKVAGVINDQVYTLSELKEIRNSLPARKEIAGFVYNKDKYTIQDIFKHLRNRFIIKSKLAEQGIVINDERVDAQIEDTKKRLRITQSVLEQSLKQRGLSFSEYYELTREIQEYNYFNQSVIAPLVNITDQELKNEFYIRSRNKAGLNFKYDIIDYNVAKADVEKLSSLSSDIKTFAESGLYRNNLRNINKVDIGKVAGEDLPKEIMLRLKETKRKSYSLPLLKDGKYHVFYLRKKDLEESSKFKNAKKRLYGQLFAKRSKAITDSWFNREALNFYILDNL